MRRARRVSSCSSSSVSRRRSVACSSPSTTYEQSAITVTNISRSFTYQMRAKINWHGYGTQSRHTVTLRVQMRSSRSTVSSTVCAGCRRLRRLLSSHGRRSLRSRPCRRSSTTIICVSTPPRITHYPSPHACYIPTSHRSPTSTQCSHVVVNFCLGSALPFPHLPRPIPFPFPPLTPFRPFLLPPFPLFLHSLPESGGTVVPNGIFF